MVGYAEYEKGYKLFDPSYQKIFIERSVQSKEEPMQEVDLEDEDCSHPPLNDDVCDVSLSDFDDDDDDVDIHSYHDSPIHPKWVEKTIQEVGDLVGDLLDSRKTRSQLQNSFSTSEMNIS